MKNYLFIFTVLTLFSCAGEKQERAIEQQPEKKDTVIVQVKPVFSLSKLKGTWKLQDDKESADGLFYDNDLFINDSIWQMCDPSRKPVMGNESTAYMMSCRFYQCVEADSLKGTVSLRYVPDYMKGEGKPTGRTVTYEIKKLTDSSLVLHRQETKEEGVYIRSDKMQVRVKYVLK